MTQTASYTIQPKRKRHSVRQSRAQKALLGSSALTTFAAMAMAVVVPGQAFAVADPSSLTTVSGSVSHTLTAPGQLQTNQTTNRAIITGANVDVLDGESWRIVQPSSSSALLVRVNGGSPTKILGELTANGQLMLVNGAGVFFGKNSQVNVAGLIASTADISNENFNAGVLKFDRPGRANASIINQGNITAKEGGLVALLAPGVQNDGVITADVGSVVIGAGEAFTLDFYGDDLFRFSVDKKAEAKAA
ncbi:MAG: filamentous hemagglutinin N-terminal domain-containing protein, partial [Rickettsiales bacterium]|nr:filamentous hemagglutinin N-terminal domain-containing protein [Rickettsiales bacterium]